MIDDALIQGVQKIANYRMKKDYPLLSNDHFNESDVRIILESLAMILEEHGRLRTVDKGRTKSLSIQE